jgi:hypothetical protein
MQKWKIRLVLTWMMTLLSVTIITAQATCSEVIEAALTAVNENCEILDVNNACYGFDFVQAAFLSEVAEDYFALPADTASILDLETIATAALDEENGTWGVAVMSIQANISNTLPGQAVTFVLMGDTEVENAVAPDEAFQPASGIEVTITSPDGANIRSGPGLNFNVVGGARPDTTLQADGQSEDGEWLRVVYRERVAWVAKLVLAEDTAMNDLPVLTPELRTTMQAFYLRTGIGETTCEDAPDDILLVQGPDNIEIELTVNGANVEIGSTIGLRIIEIDNAPFLEMLVFSGRGTVNGVEVPVGYRTVLCLGEENSRGMDGEANDLIVNCEPSDPEPVEDFGEQWCYLEQLPASILNYSIEILCPGETPPPAANTGGGTASNSQLRDIDCSPLILVAPLIPVHAGNHTFSWTPATGDNIVYELVFYNVDGVQVETFRTSNTSYFINLGQQTATGGAFEWEVRVFDEAGQYACVSQRSPRLMRTADADPPPVVSSSGGGGFTAAVTSCTNPGNGYEAVISWAGAGASASITITGTTASLGNPINAGGSGASGSATLYSWDSSGMNNINISTSSGDSAGLGSCP